MLCELEEYVQSHVNWVHTVPCLQFWWTHLIQEINPASVNSQLPIWSPTGHGDRLWSLMNKLPTSHRLVGGTTKSIGAPCESQCRTTWGGEALEWKEDLQIYLLSYTSQSPPPVLIQRTVRHPLLDPQHMIPDTKPMRACAAEYRKCFTYPSPLNI